ncbi:MAG: sulfotransferase family protein [Gemmataceae bacterium]
MSWRETFLVHFGSGAFSGIPLGLWLRVLRENRFAVDSPYWGRAAAITFASIPNTLLRWWENLLYSEKVRTTKVDPPLFILGIWRSGTTHLHNLLAQDDRFAYPNNYQVFYPQTFLTTEKINGRLVGFFFPDKRPQDNVKMEIQGPQEDEFAFCSLTGRNCMMAWAFPRRAEYYDRYLTLRKAPESEVDEWKSALTLFVRKLSFKYAKPLVLKSPGHTCRIKLLLDLFPDAKFVHIRRNPYDVFQSTIHTVRKVTPWWALQRPDYRNLEDRTLRQYKEVYEAFFAECGLIPNGHFHEIRFENLEADPISQVRSIYKALSLPDFEFVEPSLRRYLDSIAGYKKNKLPELAGDMRLRVAREWRKCFEGWDYHL